MTIRYHLNSRVVAILSTKVLRNLDTTQAEFPKALLLDCRDQDGVEVAPGFIAESDEHLYGGARMTHCQLDGTTSKGPCRTAVANGGAAAGKGALVVFVGFAGRREVQSEVGGDDGKQEGESQENELHDESDFDGCKEMIVCVFFRISILQFEVAVSGTKTHGRYLMVK